MGQKKASFELHLVHLHVRHLRVVVGRQNGFRHLNVRHLNGCFD
jgi:hypothetical protein